MLQFLVDENVSRFVVDRLTNAGFVVARLAIDLRGSPDDEVMRIAASGGHVVITEDRGFGEFAVRRGMPVRGLILLELDRLSNEAEAERVLESITLHRDRLEGHLTVIEPGRTRIRALP